MPQSSSHGVIETGEFPGFVDDTDRMRRSECTSMVVAFALSYAAVMSVLRALAVLLLVSSFAARAQQVVELRTSVDVLSFSRDDSFAVALERYDTGTAISSTFLIINEDGTVERLRLTERVRMLGANDGVPVAECEATVARLRTVAKQLSGVAVVGLCSHPARPVVKTTQRPNPVVVDDDIGLAHQRVGFPGRTWLSPRKRYALVIGSDMFGAPRIATTPMPAATTP